MGNKIYLGIDPGNNGGIAVIIDNELVFKSVVPTKKVRYTKSGKERVETDYEKLQEIFVEIQKIVKDSERECIATIERVHARFGDTPITAFALGSSFSALLSACIYSDFTVERVSPQKWQTFLFENVQECTKRDGKRDTKKMALNYITSIMIGTDFRKSKRARVPHDGIIDASCIAKYSMNYNIKS